MKKLYKFMDKKFLQELEKTGKFYINHINNYKENELGSEVGDDHEGHLKVSVNIGKYELGSNKNPAFEKVVENTNVFKLGKGVKVNFENINIVNNHKENNFHVYCSCLENNKNLKKEFGDATLIINNIQHFINHLSKALERKGYKLFIVDNCKYISNRELKFNENNEIFTFYHPAIIKDQRYSYQKEFRILWKPMNNKEITKPLFIKCEKALKYCSFKYD